MGVQGLWELLAPVGRRVSVETLAGKKLAIDASIWMIQFMKAMRDERGEMVRNAHLLGFFRRICKLLFLRAKPVFVFDGGTPALKRRTVAARRRHRENARAKIRKTAEKLLLNHLKSKKLEELAGEIKKSKSGVNDELKANQIASSNSDSPIFGKFSCPGQNSEVLDRSINQESLDKLLAASIAAEEEGNLGGNEPVITENVNYEEQDEDDEDKVMLFPVNSGNIDPAVLASLPPSMQLDLLDQMREKLMAENRQKYQKIKKVPAKFSELQIQSYLKTVAFRREINEVQKCASGRGVGGLQTSRIASEANREYIFSSSFTGDKLKLTPTSTEKNGSMVNHEMKMPAAQNASSYKLFMSPSKPTVDMSSSVDTREHTPDVETYLDERGRVRVSRVRGLGIHMTRDLQRNLDLMKEHEQVLVMKDMGKISEPVCDDPAFLKEQYQTNGTSNLSLLKDKSSHYTSTLLASKGIYEEIGDDIGNSSTIPVKETAIEVTFSEDETGSKAMVDGFFMKLVSENTTAGLFSESIPLEEKIDDTDSESLWEDGVVGEQSSSFKNYGDQENQLSFVEDKDNEEEEVLWEEDSSLVSLSVESTKTLSCGTMEEDADLKEAIRRSLDDINSLQYSTANPFGVDTQTVVSGQSSFISDKSDLNIDVLVPRAHLQTASMGLLKEERSYKSNSHQSVAPHNEYLHTSTVVGCPLDRESILDGYKETLTVCNNVGVSLDSIEQPVCQSSLQNQNNPSNLLLEPNLDKTDDHALECMKIDCEPTCSTLDFGQGDTLNDSVTIHPNYTSEIRSSTCSSSSEALGSRLFKVTSTEKIAGCVGGLQELADNSTYKGPGEGLSVRDQGSILKDNKCEASEADLHDEISLLKQERTYLGIEQRKLERNAESASSEMFAECQELLQMFGLPYIIAPMEAEAQCAYMEMTKLVDGIVTDDSDVFLFGARNVFKNIFDDRKYVETYFMKDIENELGLSRDKLIHIALLLGSDYTEGVSGIGIVNAIEVINAFPEKDGLLKFKNWVESPDPSILGLHGSQYGGSLSKSSSITNGNATYVMETNIQCSASMESVLIGDKSSDNTDVDVQVKKVFMDKHRNVSKNWHFPPSFPSESVVTAYISPQIDESTEPFAWGKPDLPLLRKMCWENFGWPTQKADELLVPVLREYNKHETQLRIEAFYSFNERFAKIRSQRIKKAVKGIAGIGSSGLTDIADGESNSNLKRGTSSKKSSKASESKSPLPHLSPESSKLGGGSEKTEQMGNAKVSGRGRGKRKRNESLNEDTIESTSVDVSSTSATQRSNQPPEVLPEMRRSVRRRKQVNYAEDDTEITTLSTPDKAADAAPIEHIKVTSQDYLHSGGGFCLEENEIQEQSFPATIPTALSFDQSNDVRVLPVDNEKCSSHLLNLEISQDLDRGSIGQGDVSKGHRGAAEEAIAVPDDLHGEQDKADVSGKGLLSAMPSLKRKRRIR